MKLFNFDVEKKWDYENGYFLTSDTQRLPKVLAHYELYKLITNLPGHVMEFGVFKGLSFVRWGTFRDALESQSSRKIIGFDAFGRFPNQNNEADEKVARSHDEKSGLGIPKDELEKVLSFKSISNCELIAGDINKTLPEYLESRPELKIALLHIDVDVYQPTKLVLERLYENVVRGGVIVFDDYALIHGETKAVDEFFADKDVTIQKFPFCHTPSFVIKK